jgi:hypothetical protein
MSGLRLALVALLIASTALFAAGVIAERSQTDDHAEPVSAQAHESGESATEPEGAHADEREAVLGIDIESTPLIVFAVIAGLGLAMLAATPLARRPTVRLTIAAIAAAWAALDVREAVHQIDESRTGITILAVAVALLHLAAAGLAARERTALGPAA